MSKDVNKLASAVEKTSAAVAKARAELNEANANVDAKQLALGKAVEAMAEARRALLSSLGCEALR